MQSTIILTKGMKHRAILLLVAIMVFFQGCHREKKVNGLIDKQRLAGLIIEMYVGEAKLGMIKIPKDSAMKLFHPFEKSVMERDKISEKDLKETYRYYLDHPIEFEEVYDIVMDTLSLREKRAEQASRKI
jgi:Domain of unknown function (DUF4296)